MNQYESISTQGGRFILGEAPVADSVTVNGVALPSANRAGGYQGMVYTADGPAGIVLKRGGLPGVIKAANSGRGAESAFEALAKANPGQPAFCAEFWAGWFDTWGRPHHYIGSQGKLADFEWMVRSGASFNVYLFHGGSTRGLWDGCGNLPEESADQRRGDLLGA